LFYILLVHAGIFVDSQSVKRERNAALAEIQTAQLVLASERAMREEQGIFFAFVAHELRSPLAAILTGLKNLENECTDMQQALLQRARRIKTYAERMSRVIDRHLSLQRLASAEFAPEFAPIDPRHIAEESLGRVQALFTDRVFVADYAADLPTGISGILGDADLLHMALDNLLTNAAKYSPEKTDIAFDVWVDAALHFRVSDRGPGVAAGQVSRMFSVFNRLQQPGFTGGFGIGLAIARRIAQAHGGNLLYADRAGGGAVFTLSLPLSPVAAEDAA
jgi:two-component system sensor histidine kinase KdpD